ncbi:MAG TPA: LPD7 domain-containing protein [Steroidobacteraceae bacterium]
MTLESTPPPAAPPPEPRHRKKSAASMREADTSVINGIERGRAPEAEPNRAGADPKSNTATTAPEMASRSHAMPEEIRERFIGIGAKYYFPDGAAAFTDHGTRLTTRSENTEVIRSLVAIAQAREWGEIKVTGTERFRKEAWFAARIAGLEVRGYTPTEFEEERVVRAIARRESIAAGRESLDPASGPREASPSTSDRALTDTERSIRAPEDHGPISGRLVDHGRATYRHNPKEPMSYYVRVETSRGDREIWGVDLERAFRESLSRPTIGDEVTARSHGRDWVTVKTPEGEVATHRNRWIVERRDFLVNRAAAAQVFRDAAIKPSDGVKVHPELQGSYLQLQAAKLGAERDIRDPEDQARFVARARTAIAEAIERGEPLEPVRLRVKRGRTPEPEKARTPDQAPTR